ncbi:TPA: histidine--tRNA ligase [Candidatus Komeilibacteria bacterium]|nr:histidine--tRNA ligase [Candidatus Komeilibacteria bacterium]
MTKKDKAKKAYASLRGMKDILPSEQRYWDFVYQRVYQFAEDYGFKRIETPVLEAASLFTRSVGTDTDIVSKEMYVFVDPGNDKVALRPENTASIVRAYIEHGMLALPQPVKLFYFGPMFRHDRPQAGRQRQFWQFGFEVLGDNNPIVDARLVAMSYKFYVELNMNVQIEINSIGCAECRPKYLRELTNYLKKVRKDLGEEDKKRLAKNPLRILDSKDKQTQDALSEVPHTVDHLCDDCKNHFVMVLEYLDELEVPYALNPTIVRGLDYYTRTTFEVTTVEDAENGDKSRQIALGGGGRYDKLYESLGGRETPVVGFAAGIERLIGQIKEKDLKVPALPQAEIFLAQLGTEARRKALVLFEELYRAGFKVTEAFSKSGIKPQLEMADRLGAKLCLIVGQKEIIDGTVMIRDMDGGIQEVVDYKKIVPELRKRLEKMAVVRVAIEDKTV